MSVNQADDRSDNGDSAGIIHAKCKRNLVN